MADAVETWQNKGAEHSLGDAPETDDPERPERDWLMIAKQAFHSSTTFIDSNFRSQWERSLDLFHSRHPARSKYHAPEWKYRARNFRPKTRGAVRKAEASAAQAFFSTQDVVKISARDERAPEGRASAALVNELVNYRLQRTIPWFQILVGGVQDANVQGVVISKQYWDYQEAEGGLEMDEMGMPAFDEMGMPQIKTEVRKDEPVIKLYPAENVRIHAAADWLDPVNASPFLILMNPMHAGDVLDRMNTPDPKTGQPAWKPASMAKLKAATANPADSVRQSRSDDRADPYSDELTGVDDFDIVWVFEVFVRLDGEDLTYWTLSEHSLLTDPVPVREAYRHLEHGERPVVMGAGLLETHRAFPSSKVALTQEIQAEMNDTANLRLDNVKLAMTGRFFVRAGVEIDYEALKRSVPGGIVPMHDPETDVIIQRAPDVTASAYQEQAYLNNDFDEIQGQFSQSSIQTNRQLNETVGGMTLLSGSANAMTEYDLRVITETWVEKVLGQIVRLEQAFESDEVVLALAADKAQAFQKFDLQPGSTIDDLLRQELTVSVNVGIGAVDPMMRAQKFQMAMGSMMQMLGPSAVKVINIGEVANEIFGLAGYKDASRFLNLDPDDPQTSQYQMIIEDLEKQLQEAQSEAQSKVKVAEIGAGASVETTTIKSKTDLAIAGMKSEDTKQIESQRSEDNRKADVRDFGKQVALKAIEGRAKAMEPAPPKPVAKPPSAKKAVGK